MAMDLERQVFSTERKYFEAGTTIGITSEVKPASAELKEHAPVLLKDGKAAPVTSADLADLSGLYGITADSVAAAEDDAVILLTGEFFADALELEEGVTADDLEVAFRNIGVFLK